MKQIGLTTVFLMVLAVPLLGQAEQIQARLGGYEEVPAVSTPATGTLRGKINHQEDTIDYTLTYRDLVGTVQQAHIHFGQKSVNGSVVLWLCQTTTTPAPPAVAALTPFCPAPGGTVSGTLTAANVLAAGTASQQISAGELEEVIDALRAGVAYVNVHATPLNPGGEIRGQIRASHHPHD